jgi:ABC-type multidrug transport system ATPase subunit
MLEISRLTVTLGGTEVLHDVTCSAAAGEIVAVIGPNGAGKTTLLHAIAGLIGDASCAGSIDVCGAGGAILCPDGQLAFLDLTVLENLELMMLGLEWERETRDERRESLLSLVLQDAHHGRPVHTLSSGVRRRLDIVLTICKPAGVYLFDEPFNGLDADWTRTFLRIVRCLSAAGRTCVIASHAIDLLLPVSSSLWELNRGLLVRAIRDDDGKLDASVMNYGDLTHDQPIELPWL